MDVSSQETQWLDRFKFVYNKRVKWDQKLNLQTSFYSSLGALSFLLGSCSMSLNSGLESNLNAALSASGGGPSNGYFLNFSPPSGPVGTLVSVSGIDFSNFQSASLGSGSLLPVSQTSTELTVLLLPGVSSGPIAVHTAGGVFFSPSSFIISSTRFLPNPVKVQGGGSIGGPHQGAAGPMLQNNGNVSSVALSADGSTAVMGGYNDGPSPGATVWGGAAWIFTRSSNRLWSQQGAKLFPSDALGTNVGFGCSVAISADGNTVLIGGWHDDTQAGAAWVFTRTNGAWTQQGPKLVGSGVLGTPLGPFGIPGGRVGASQGLSVALSADGNTALIGGPTDNDAAGAAWVFTRSQGAWTQQGKLVGPGASNSGIGPPFVSLYGAEQGSAVALSADGNTALLGGMYDRQGVGAAWIFTRAGGTWSSGVKLVDPSASSAFQGTSVAISADGKEVLVGGTGDSGGKGAVWVYRFTAGSWTSVAKLVPNDGSGSSLFGTVSLSADGQMAFIGGGGDAGGAQAPGAAWVFIQSAGVWTQQGSKYVPSTQAVAQGSGIALSSDGSTGMACSPADNRNSMVGVGACFVYSD
jgi:hypothetical protein